MGAGFGFFTVPAAMIVGPTGYVYSVEPDPIRSERIRRRVTAEKLENVKVLTTGVERLEEIPSGNLDLAFSAYSIHHFNNREKGLEEIRRCLRKGGKFYVWDRVPGLIMRHGTRPEEVEGLSQGFSKLEVLSTGPTLRVRFTR